MKKFLLPIVGLLTSLLTAQAQSPWFTPGNLAVVRIGGTNSAGAGEYVTTSDDGNTVYIDQYTTNGVLVNSLPVPSTGPNALILSGEPYEGLMSITPDNGRLVLIGYNTPYPYSAELIDSASATIPRIVATIDAYGNFAYPITNYGIFDTSYVTTCAASDGTNFWAVGTGPTSGSGTTSNQVAYLGTATNPTTNFIAAGLFNSGARTVNVLNVGGSLGLYVVGYTAAEGTVMGGGFLCSNISGALPTTQTGTTNLFPTGLSSGNTGPYDLAINPAGTLAYVTDEGQNGIVKFTYNSGSGLWVSNYTIGLTNSVTNLNWFISGDSKALSVTVNWAPTQPVLYAVTYDGEYTNRLVSLTDTGTAIGANATLTMLASNIFNPTGPNSGTNCFRGVRYVPLPVPAFTAQPVPFFGVPGVTATFSGAATGIPAPTYQWYSNSPANPTYVAIPGATATNLTLANINQSQNGSLFFLIASNTYGTSQSAVVSLTVQNPAITAEPVGATNFPGSGPVSLCVSAIGTGTLTYQWLSNGVSLGVSAQSACYSVPSSAVSNSALYSVIVSNSSNQSITSSVTTVSYTPYLLFDTFAYPNGNLFTDSGTQWTETSGTTSIPTTNGRVQINESNAATGTAIGHDLFTQAQAEGTYVWASFTINLSTLPTTPGGVYFASFADTAFDFFGKIYVLTTNTASYTPDIPHAAYPGTYRIGIANYAGPSAVVELDMAPGIDYHVVVYYGVGGFAQVSVNPSPAEYSQSFYPSGPNSLTSGYAQDTYTYTGESMAAWELHETSAVGVFELSDLQVSYDWNGAGSGFATVTADFTTNLPVIGLLTPGLTNYLGNTGVLEVAASGIDLTYQWYLNGEALSDTTNFAGSESNALVFSYLASNSPGNYTVVVSNEAGSVTSAVSVVDVITTPAAPIFTVQPVSTTNSLGGTATFTASAVGTGPITYEWYQVPDTDTGVSGSTLTLSHLTTNESGDLYYVVATGGTGLTNVSSNALLIVNGPIVTNIAFLRSLQVTNAAPTITVPASNSVQVYQVTGTVMEYTNIESATYAEYWIQDSTAGIEFFVTDPTFRPHMGDLITVSGIVDVYSDALELDGSANNPSEPYTITSTNGEGLPLPYPPELIPFGFATATTPAGQLGISSLFYQGKLGMFTNCYFEQAGQTFAGEATLTVTNKAGQSYDLFVSQSAGSDLIGQTIPAFAYSITGEYDQFDSEYELNISAGFNIVATPPPPVTNVTTTVTGTNITLTWPVALSPNTTASGYTYSVWSTTNLLVPFAPLAPGLWFGTSNGTYTTSISTNAGAMFFQINSP